LGSNKQNSCDTTKHSDQKSYKNFHLGVLTQDDAGRAQHAGQQNEEAEPPYGVELKQETEAE
jgi:hypothetical protein